MINKVITITIFGKKEAFSYMRECANDFIEGNQISFRMQSEADLVSINRLAVTAKLYSDAYKDKYGNGCFHVIKHEDQLLAIEVIHTVDMQEDLLDLIRYKKVANRKESRRSVVFALCEECLAKGEPQSLPSDFKSDPVYLRNMIIAFNKERGAELGFKNGHIVNRKTMGGKGISAPELRRFDNNSRYAGYEISGEEYFDLCAELAEIMIKAGARLERGIIEGSSNRYVELREQLRKVLADAKGVTDLP